MSSEQRRRSRIQGGWANQSQSFAPRSDTRGSGAGSTTRRPADTREDTSSGWAKDRVSGLSAAIVLDDSATATAPNKFTFDADSCCKKEPIHKVIDTSGIYIISSEPSGVSSIQLMQGFIEQSECDWIFEQIHEEVPWKQQPAIKNGQTYPQPRLTAWFGEHPYAYSGITHEENLTWTPIIQMLGDRIEEVTSYTFNSVLGNLYRDGHDHVPWHCDDEVSLGNQPLIASLSFGDTRNFELRKKPPKDIKDPDDSDYPEYIKIPLDAGSLLIMKGCVQDDWQHRIPREYHDRGPRINLTYRTILPS